MKLLYDVQNNKWYNENGESFSNEQPAIPYGNTERIEIQLYAEVNGTNSGREAVEDWVKYTEFSDGGYSAILATDNNFQHWYKGSLKEAVSPETATSGIHVETTQNIDDIAENGNIYLYAGDTPEALSYSSRQSTEGGILFTLSEDTLPEGSYAQGSKVDIPEMLYAEAAMIPEESDPATGLFVFDFICDSQKLRNQMRYSSVEMIDDCKGLEITIFQAHENSLYIRKRFCCNTFQITGGIADIHTNAPLTSQEESQYLAALNGFVSQGLELQCSTDGNTWLDYADISNFSELQWFRMRIKGSNSEFSDKIPIIRGLDGTLGSIGPAGEDGKSVYFYIGYASDSAGTNFSTTPSDSLKYIAFLVSDTQKTNLTAADFASANWVKYIGNDGDSTVGVLSVNGETGTVTLDAAGIGADAAGTAETAVSNHNSSADAHTTLFAAKLDVPSGGTTGQFLAKTADGTEWKTVEIDGINTTFGRALFANPVYSDTEEYCLLDDVNTEIQTEFVYNASTLKLVVASADTSVTGNIIITAGGQTFTVPTANSKTLVSLAFTTPYTGVLTLETATDNTGWTLKDGEDIVSAKIYQIYVGEGLA